MSDAFKIRPGRPVDVATIAAFNLAMAWETEKLRLDAYLLERGVRGAIDDPAKGRYFVAEVENAVIACLLITHEWSDWRNGDIWWIQSVYVTPSQRRKGVFRSMYQHVEQLAREQGVVAIRLYVEKANAAGKATYLKLGMEQTHYDVMQQDLT